MFADHLQLVSLNMNTPKQVFKQAEVAWSYSFPAYD